MKELITQDDEIPLMTPIVSEETPAGLSVTAKPGTVEPMSLMNGLFTKRLLTDIDGAAVELFSDEKAMVYLPSRWASDSRALEMWNIANEMIIPAHSAVKTTPWVIGSTWEDIFGNPRTNSAVHLDAKAFDMSPMYDEATLLSPRKQLMGLAWNLLSLTYLSTLNTKLAAFVVEGDHIHVAMNGRPHELQLGQLFAVWSKAPWYAIDAIVEADSTVKRLFGLPFLFDARKMSVTGPSVNLASKLSYYLGYPGAPKK